MTIENAKYIKDEFLNRVVSINCIWGGKFMAIPLTVGNRHYDAILVWAAIDGNSIADAD